MLIRSGNRKWALRGSAPFALVDPNKKKKRKKKQQEQKNAAILNNETTALSLTYDMSAKKKKWMWEKHISARRHLKLRPRMEKIDLT
ncbi:hypothetical protein CEXT_447551 [Caerostris extrusa]|uniref:Uncharacterized protein n=1 Tax=Caerostris extrusa TaxID=172846 RepID=A0AAV4N075_CAEEX|nr:hypothetical protein CEXT_447551 [Caerostris extrusa]